MNNDLMFSSAKNDWGTPQAFFDRINEKYGFTLDAAASHDNTKCDWYYTAEGLFRLGSIDQYRWNTDNGLTGKWGIGLDWTWCNPPYGRGLKDWVAKAYTEMCHGHSSVLLLPARTDTLYFHDYIWSAHDGKPRHGISVNFLKGRLKFEGAVNQKTGKADPAPFPSMLVEFSSYDYKR